MIPSETEFAQAVVLLTAGELVAFPTETVYGLGADASNADAVAKIFAAKGRPADHPLIVHLPADDWVEHWAQSIPDPAWELMESFWPGPLTLILKKQPWVPDLITGGQQTVGLRVPGHPVALELLRRFAQRNAQGGIAAPSANRFGRVSPTTAAHVRAELGEQLMVLEGGACAVGIESTIVDCSRQEPVILRPGHIAPAHLAEVLGFAPEIETAEGAPRVSGSLPAHYAPNTPMRLLRPGELDALSPSVGTALLAHSPALAARAAHWPAGRIKLLPAEPVAYAHNLYAALRALDKSGAEIILVELTPDAPAWSAVNDRLRRALAGSN
ncbi:MAG: Threonylcarbamoyl-AMP synthase [Betaproteobacteria bacterium ADurb.Bin341]|nr:MAG: Threonylcarbamoyl-AMP synthase [Betaproteobacteria bacterium ADurb.Bin341]